jgi:hypothetical protein
MAALHAAVTGDAGPDRNLEPAHERALHRQLLLILRHRLPPVQGARTVRTLRRQRDDVGFIDVRRRAPMRAGAIGRAGFAAGPLRMSGHLLARERRGLSVDGAPGGIQLFLQPLVFAPQAIALRLRASQVFAQAFDGARLLVDDLLRIARRSVGRLLSDALVIAHRSAKYPYKELITSI